MDNIQPPRRKTTTSSAVKARYNKKVYAPVQAQLPKDIVAAFKSKCADRGVSQAQVLREAIEAFLAQE